MIAWALTEGELGDSLGHEGEFSESLILIPTPILHRYSIAPVFYYTGILLHRNFITSVFY